MNNIKKNCSKDLLRLEKNYFPGIYHEDKNISQKEFIINKLLIEEKIKKQPKFHSVERSNSFFLYYFIYFYI